MMMKNEQEMKMQRKKNKRREEKTKMATLTMPAAKIYCKRKNLRM